MERYNSFLQDPGQNLPSGRVNVKVLALVVSKEPPEKTLRSLAQQTLPPTFTVWVSAPGVVKALNDSWKTYRKDGYDYLLRTAGDIYLPRNWLESALLLQKDVVGSHGDAMLIHSRVMSALHFYDNPVEDSSFICTARLLGFSYSPEKVKHINLRRMGAKWPPRQFLERGKWTYILGYGPVNFLWNTVWATVIHMNFRFLAGLWTYLFALLISHPQRWPTQRTAPRF